MNRGSSLVSTSSNPFHPTVNTMLSIDSGNVSFVMTSSRNRNIEVDGSATHITTVATYSDVITLQMGISSSTSPAFNTVASLLLSIAAIAGFILNLFVVVAVLSNRQLRRRIADVLCCHLAFVGLIWCSVLLPVNVVSAAMSVVDRSLADRSAFCLIHGYFRSAATHASVWTVVALGFDKYRTIMAPLHHVTEADFRRVSAALATIWLGALGLAGPPLFSDAAAIGRYGVVGAVSACGYVPAARSGILSSVVVENSEVCTAVYVAVTLLFGFALPLGVVSHCYFRIYHVARWHRQRIAAMASVVNVITLSLGVPMVARGIQHHQPQQQHHHQQQRSPPISRQQQLPLPGGQSLLSSNGNGSGQLQPVGAAPSPTDSGNRKWKSSSSRTLITIVGSFLFCYAPHYVVLAVSTAMTSFPVGQSLVGAIADLMLFLSPLVNALVYGVRNRTLVKSFRTAVRSSVLKRSWNRAAAITATRV